MKFSTSIILALTSTVISATPHSLSRRVADPTGVQDAITQWLADIAAVNNFLNIAGNIDPDAVADAMAVLPMAMDEPVQLMNLAGDVLPTDSQAQNAIQELMTNFPTVPAALMTIAMSGGDQSVIQTQVNIINDIRCEIVLPNIGMLFNAAAAENGLGAQATPPGPVVCPNPPTFADGS